MIVCGSGPRAVVTTASYEARRLAGIHSAMPAAIARRRLPDAVYLSPDFAAYREASGEVMAILRANAETVEVVGLDEAYVELTGLFSPKSTMRRIATEIREGTGLTCSIGISENRMLAKITSELGKPAGLVVLSRERGARALRGRLPRPGPGDRPEDGREAGADGDRTLAELRGARAAELEAAFGPRMGGWLPRRGRLRGRDAALRRARDQVAVGRDDLRRRRRRPRGDGRLARLARRGALPAPALARARGAHDRDQGAPRRLDQRHPLAHRRGPTADPAVVGAGRPRPAARLRAAAAGAPARRPRRRVRRGRGRRRGGRAAEPQLRLGLPAERA